MSPDDSGAGQSDEYELKTKEDQILTRYRLFSASSQYEIYVIALGSRLI